MKTEKQANRAIYKWTDIPIDKQANRQTPKQKNRYKDKQTNRLFVTILESEGC